jgi:hypothetical protein
MALPFKLFTFIMLLLPKGNVESEAKHTEDKTTLEARIKDTRANGSA